MTLTTTLSKDIVRIALELFLPAVVWVVAGHLIAVRVFDWVYVVRFGMYADMQDALFMGVVSYIFVFIMVGVTIGIINAKLFEKVNETYGRIV